MIPWVAPHSTRWYGPGEHCSDPRDGDVFFTNHGTVFAAVLLAVARVFAWLRPSLRPYVWCDHAAFIRVINGVAFVSEMTPRGHRLSSLEKYRSRLYSVTAFEVPDEDRARVCGADDRTMHLEYGWALYLPQAIDGLTGLRIAAASGSSMDCSAHVGICGWNVYWTLDDQPIAKAPWDLAKALDVHPAPTVS